MSMIEAKNLCKTYIVDKRQNNVLKNVSFKVEKGEMVGIMGPSGSGKSTLLYCISGMDRTTSGEVMFDGKDITKLSPNVLAELRLNKMGFIFQQMFMMKNLSILDNILGIFCSSNNARILAVVFCREGINHKDRGCVIKILLLPAKRAGCIQIPDSNRIAGKHLLVMGIGFYETGIRL